MTMASTHHQISPLCRFLESVLRANDVGSSSEGGLDAYALFVLVTAFCQDQARRSDGTGARAHRANPSPPPRLAPTLPPHLCPATPLVPSPGRPACAGASCCGVTLQRLLKSMTRCLRRGGCLAVTCSNPPCLSPICVAAQSDLRQRASREFRQPLPPPHLRGEKCTGSIVQTARDPGACTSRTPSRIDP